MERKETETALAKLAAPYLAHQDLDLWGVEFFGGAGRSLVRIYIDGPDGVDVEDCARVSRHLGEVLEVENLIHGPYTLEVSSPGLERTFFSPGQMTQYVGRTVDLSTHAAREGRKRFSGTLVGVEGEVLTVEVDGQPLRFAWDEIKKAKLVHEFESNAAPGKGRAKPAPPRTGGRK